MSGDQGPTRARRSGADTASRLLDVAERLVQRRGFNGFSYADVADELGVTKAALHYHYASKAELGTALVERYAARFLDALGAIDVDLDARQALHAYADLYLSALRDDRMCLCGMLAAEYRTLPEPMQSRLRGFFDANEEWLAALLEKGRASGTLRFAGSARQVARMVVGALEGAMLIARPYDDLERFRTAAAQLVDSLAQPATSGAVGRVPAG
ncbi:MAG: TetR/AcrR family transcriptional regulator [Acidimicrobiales bacterium]|nr:TetR/AcrR family transcriptional regulator [Acidimicrobiales bacterium]